MHRLGNAIVIVITIRGASAFSQVHCLKSWKSGDRKVKSGSFVVTLDSHNSSFGMQIRDSKGRPFSKFGIDAGWAGKPRRIIEWRMALMPLSGKNPHDLLKPTHDPYQDAFGPLDYPGWFLLGSKIQAPAVARAALPITGIRAIEIEGFYCLITLKDFNRDPLDESAFEQATFQIDFINDYIGCNKEPH